MRKKVYVGCGLSHAPADFKFLVERFKDKLRPFAEVLDFKGEQIATPHEVYRWDIHECVHNCDLMIAICDFASTGLGYEMATQLEKRGKPLLAMAHVDARVTRLILDPRIEDYRFERYTDLLVDGLEYAKKAIEEVSKIWQPSFLLEQQIEDKK